MTNPQEYREAVGDALDRVAELVVQHLEDRQRLSRTAAWALDRLHREGPVRLTALVTGARVSQPAMTELVQRLRSQGLVTRVSDPADGRVALVGITDAGRALLADRRQERRHRLADLLATLPAEDEPALALAMHVALPIVQRLLHNAAQAGTPTGLAHPDGATGTKRGAPRDRAAP